MIGKMTKMKGNSYKSKFEKQFAEQYKLPYEQDKIKYTIDFVYHPDWKVADNVYIETKGIFDFEDRRKTLAVKKQHPNIIVALVFQNSKAKIYKGSNTTYSEWCDKHKIDYFDITDTVGIKQFINDNQ